MKEILEETTCLKEDEIKRYLAEESSTEELRRVENHLLDCPFCTDAVEGLEGYYSFETDKDLDILKTAIENQQASETKETKVITMNRGRQRFNLNRIAAAVLLLVIPAASWFYISNNNTTSSVDFGNSSTLRSGSEVDEEGTALLKVINLYETEKYEAALAAAESMLATKREDVKTTYYAGLAAMKLEEYKIAADHFMTVRLNSDFYYEDATWMEAQSTVEGKDTLRAIVLLDGILKDKDSDFYDEAAELRKRFE